MAKAETKYLDSDTNGWLDTKVVLPDGRAFVVRRPKSHPDKVVIQLHVGRSHFELQAFDLDYIDILQELLTYVQLRAQGLAQAEAEALEAEEDLGVDEDYANLR